jgi:hypothetical protein
MVAPTVTRKLSGDVRFRAASMSTLVFAGGANFNFYRGSPQIS